MLEALENRRSVRKYTARELPEEHIEELFRAAMYAPSAWGKRPWHFVVVRDPELRKKLSQATPYSSHAAQAPVVIVLLADMCLARRWVEDLSIAASHIMLQAVELGYGSCFIQVRESEHSGKDAQDYVRGVLGIPQGYNVGCMLSVGEPAEEKEPHKGEEFMEGRVHWEKRQRR